jgi:hypothetical protein
MNESGEETAQAGRLDLVVCPLISECGWYVGLTAYLSAVVATMHLCARADGESIKLSR